MAREDGRSLTDLQEDAERNRAELSETVDQLRSKVSDTVTDLRKRASPESMKEEVRDYFRSKAEILIDKGRQNPLQAAAIGLGVAYPLLGIVRAIPAPIMMIGAGLYFLGSNSGQKVTNDVSRKMSSVAGGLADTWGVSVDAAGESIRDSQDVASAGLESARDAVLSQVGNLTQKASQKASAAGAAISGLRDSAADLASSAADGAAALKERALSAAGATSDAMLSGAANASAIAAKTASSAGEFGTDAALGLRDRAISSSQRVSSAIGETIQSNPLLVGGLGLVVGMLIASALPKSEMERGVMGSASADVKKRANELAARGFDAAKGFASGAITELSQRAGQEGLTPTDLSAAAEDLGRRVRKVAESATEAALGGADDKPFDTHAA